MLRLFGKSNTANCISRRRWRSNRPSVEPLENKALLSVIGQGADVTGQCGVSATLLSSNIPSITQLTPTDIAPISVASSNTATGVGSLGTPENASYATSLTTTFSSPIAASIQSGTVSMSGSIDTMPYTVASVNNHYSLSIEADENGVFTINYNVNSEPYSLGIITIPSASLTIRDANTVIGGQTDLYVDSTKSGSYSLPVTKGYVYSIVATNEYAIGGSSSNTEHHDASVDFSWGFTSAVSATTTTTTVQADHNPSTYGQPVTFTTTITSSNSASAVPSGTVQFVIDGSNYGNPVPLNNGKAKIVDGALPVSGSPHTVTAVYSGDSIFAGSTGSLPNGQTVQPVSVPTITLTSLHQASIPSTAPGINFTYTVTGSLTAPASINFYWASGNSLDVKTNPDPAYTYSIDTPAREATGTHGTIFIPRADFADVPYGTTYLVATLLSAGGSGGFRRFPAASLAAVVRLRPSGHSETG